MKNINIELSGVCMSTNCNREILKDLDMHIACERVALIGRNGVGKSTLLKLIIGSLHPAKGRVSLSHKPYYISQYLASEAQEKELKNSLELIRNLELSYEEIEKEFVTAGLKLELLGSENYHLSHGELRKLKLLVAKLSQPEILILDEPSQDLDNLGIQWLMSWLPKWPGALIVASHRKCVLKDFEHFFIMGEQGCTYFHGTYENLELKMEKDHEKSQRQYLQSLNRLEEYEEHILHIARRRARKKQYGRINELGRATPKQCLNQKRDYAQVKHGRMKRIRDSRITDMRNTTKSARRAVKVSLAMEPILPVLELASEKPALTLGNILYSIKNRSLFKDLNLSISNDKVAICGANGTGKTTLLKLMVGSIKPLKGRVLRDQQQIAYISQGAANWFLEDSLLQCLSFQNGEKSPEDLAELIISHKFPLALAQRPLKSLSPGERLRAALICIFQQDPVKRLLILDEPTYSLDLIGQRALKSILKAWKGGLVITSHDAEFLEEIEVKDYLYL